MSASNSYEKLILKNLLRGTVVSAITPYMGLSLADPEEDGSALSEPSGSGYSRVNLLDSDGFLGGGGGAVSAFLSSSIDSATGTVTNDNQIAFPEASGSWGTITHWFIANDQTATGVAILASGTLATPRTVAIGERLVFPVGSISLTAN